MPDDFEARLRSRMRWVLKPGESGKYLLLGNLLIGEVWRPGRDRWTCEARTHDDSIWVSGPYSTETEAVMDLETFVIAAIVGGGE